MINVDGDASRAGGAGLVGDGGGGHSVGRFDSCRSCSRSSDRRCTIQSGLAVDFDVAILATVETILVWSGVAIRGHLATLGDVVVTPAPDAAQVSGRAVLCLVTPAVTGSAGVSTECGVLRHHDRNLPGRWWCHSESGGVG